MVNMGEPPVGDQELHLTSGDGREAGRGPSD
jgi:hypothetical protein